MAGGESDVRRGCGQRAALPLGQRVRHPGAVFGRAGGDPALQRPRRAESMAHALRHPVSCPDVRQQVPRDLDRVGALASPVARLLTLAAPMTIETRGYTVRAAAREDFDAIVGLVRA